MCCQQNWLFLPKIILKTLLEILIFNNFKAEKLKKGEESKKIAAKFSRKMFFQVWAKTLVECFIPRKSSKYTTDCFPLTPNILD